LRAVKENLVDDDHGLIKLLTPPFQAGDQDPGYIKAYPPGIRENGGQYNHAATWAVLAAAEIGDAELAFRWLAWLNPLTRSKNRHDCERYRIEPYVVAGDIYSSPPFTGRGGWSWYSGSAAWFCRVVTEKLLGMQRRRNRLYIQPCVPEDWTEFDVAIRYKSARYTLRIHDPAHFATGKIVFVENEQVLPGTSLQLQDDGDHEVQVYADLSALRRLQGLNTANC
jgi:cyclic beta-1,2-glucan synthetase